MILDRFKVDGKVAVVTGAGRGIGAASALALAEAGADVVLSARSADQLEQVAKDIENLGRRALVVPANLMKLDAVAGLADAAYDEFGRLDIVVNNVGGTIPNALLDTDPEYLEEAFHFNVSTAHALTRAAVPQMLKNDGGSIVNISSVGAVRPSPQEAMYAASKNGLNALTMAFAQEYAPHVRVNCVMPGAFATDMADGWDEGFVAKVVDRLPAGRLGRPDEVVGMVVHLAGDSAGYTTGAVIPVDGGRTAVY